MEYAVHAMQVSVIAKFAKMRENANNVKKVMNLIKKHKIQQNVI